MSLFEYRDELVNVLTEQLGTEEMLEQVLKTLNLEREIEIFLHIARDNNINVSEFNPEF